ncbi:MAG: ATP-dependent DNA helicase [Micrococcaceae bacterium]
MSEKAMLAMLETAVDALGGQERPGQIMMAKAVTEAIEKQEHLLVQAGTGTGKSLAYLVPALEQVGKQENPMLVATATLALQNQIIKRDLPELIKTLKDQIAHPPKVVLAKGRANYLCLHKLKGGYDEEPKQDDLFTELEPKKPSKSQLKTRLERESKRIYEWAEKTATGDRDELKPGVSDETWKNFSVNANECIGSKCPFFAECFTELSRNDAREADIVVTNHAFLAAGTFGDSNILPEWDVAIIDEAHELEDRVTGAMSAQLSIATAGSAVKSIARFAPQEGDRFAKAVDRLNDYLFNVEPGLQENVPQNLLEILNSILLSSQAVLRESKKEDNKDTNRQLSRARVQELQVVCENIIKGKINGAKLVLWFNKGDDKNDPATIHYAPLNVAYVLASELFREKTVVATSATLVLGGSFEPLAKSLGFTKSEDYKALDAGSPFNYPKQGILYVSKHLPTPGRGVSKEVLEELKLLIEASKGGALCLFSSRNGAEFAADWMRKQVDYPILCQGEDTTPALVAKFADDWNACLFGTLSLWQGVDVPGDSCRMVTIDRIPFPRPDDPLVNARNRAVSEAGGNGFMSVNATIAAKRLAQGSGRLIRTIDDKGVVAVLDSRMAKMRYGSFMVKAMPNFWYTNSQETVVGALSRLSSAE